MSVEVSWFSALCDDDYRYLGVHDESLKSSWPHCSAITRAADRHGYDSILLPSGYQLGIDSVAFAGGVAPLTEQIRLLVAVRMRVAVLYRSWRFSSISSQAPRAMR